MKTLFKLAALSTLVAAPALAFAQPNLNPNTLISYDQPAQALTRAQVRANLADARKAGFDPQAAYYYPANAQVAQAAIAGSAAPLTRAQVRTELAQLEQAGFNPSNGYRYPAEAAHAVEVVAMQNNGTTAFGSAASGKAQAGE